MTQSTDRSRADGRDVLVVCADFPAATVRALKRAAIAAEIDVVITGTESRAALEVVRSAAARAIVFDMASPHAEALCSAMRTDAFVGQVPLLGIIGVASEMAFGDLFTWGADDLVAADCAEDLVPRMRALGEPPESRTRPSSRRDAANKATEERRASPRVLHGMRVWLRGAGGERDALGYAVDASLGGLFVRTLHPFEADQELWVELTPPRSTRRVRLMATVAWHRPFSAAGAAPAGVGLRIDEGIPGDLARYRDGILRLAREKGLVPRP